MSGILERLDRPLFYLDRRLPWNQRKRAAHEGGGGGVHDGGPFVVTDHGKNHEVHAAGMQAVGFLKLSAIVGAGVTPFLLVMFFVMKAVFSQSLAVERDAVMKSSDDRYLQKLIYDVKHEELKQQVIENNIRNENQETKITELRMQVQLLQEQVRVVQAGRAAR